MIQEIRITSISADLKGAALLHEIKRTLAIKTIDAIHTVKVYRLQGIDEKTAQLIAQKCIIDPLAQKATCNDIFSFSTQNVIEVGYKAGVMNPEVASLCKIIKSLGIDSLVAADTSWEYHFSGTATPQEIELICDRLLVNKTVAQKIVVKPATLIIEGKTGTVQSVPIRHMSDQELIAYAQKQQLFMNKTELHAVKAYFTELGRDPYDAELETIAQTWSEHCSHKTFKAPLFIDGKKKSSLLSRLKEQSQKYNQNTVCAFEDNAGVFRFYEGYAIAGKVETHNSPSAIEPYGGAATGSGGVFRDIMGTGIGARVIASTNIFCFAPLTINDKEVPPGCLHPNYLLRNVVAGVRDYGNRMGIPTNNGSIHFHPDFRAKPSVIVGAYGLIPEKLAHKGKPQIGNRIFVVGGKTGRDGIHGATFSSDAMTDQTNTLNATAVQIGNPIEQKRMADALLAARDEDLIQAITDCGAGGFSSAIGEMAQQIGAHVFLENAPLKYTGLEPWEIWISESQERMVCAIDQVKSDQFKKLCEQYNVSAADIGYFTGTQKLLVTYYEMIVCNLDMNFLHNGCPSTLLQANTPKSSLAVYTKEISFPQTNDEWIDRFKKLLSHGSICSKEPIVRQYDHTVQGMNALSPYAGVADNGPQDAAVLTPLYGKPYALILSHGLHPTLNRIDPYYGSWWAITEAIANLVAVGGNPRDVSLIDNFIWPKPNNEFLWALDQSIEACCDAMDAFKIPFISGKDSLSSSYQYPDGTMLHIPPVLCISAFGKIPDVSKIISSDFKQTDSLILLVGSIQPDALGGSVYQEIMGAHSNQIPKIDGKQTALLFEQLYSLIDRHLILSCHDISEGGIAIAFAEMCFGGQIGAHIEIPDVGYPLDHFIFAETAGCFLVEVSRSVYEQRHFDGIDHIIIGTTDSAQTIQLSHQKKILFKVDLAILQDAWQQPMKEVFR
jgi:phosphoribosylformylglycinamidine synthase